MILVIYLVLFVMLSLLRKPPQNPISEGRNSQKINGALCGIFSKKKTYRRGLNVFDMININIPAIISHKS